MPVEAAFGHAERLGEAAVQCEGIADEPSGTDLDRCLACYLDRFPRERQLAENGTLGLVRVRMNWIRYDYHRPETFRHLEETFPAITNG
jgi:hypothetical protein